MFVFFIVFSCFCQAEGAFQNLIFKRIPSTASITSLSCALAEYDESHARGVKFDSESGTCEALPESWFTSQTFENKTYYKLLMEERIFQAMRINILSWKSFDFWMFRHYRREYWLSLLEADIEREQYESKACFAIDGPTIISEMPSDFTSYGSSVVLNVYMGSVSGDEFMINVEGQDRSIICYHLNVRLHSDLIVFNSEKGGWGAEVSLPTNGRFSTSYTTYRFELKFTAAAIKLYLDGSLVYTFNHRMPITDCDTITYANRYDSTFECRQIQYFYPR